MEVHLADLKWNVLQYRFGLVASGLERLQSNSVELLDLLKSNLPESTGGAECRNFEKAHSILHKVREILLFRWSENRSTQVTEIISYDYIYDIIYYTTSQFILETWQGPEHCHIDFKRLACCADNKDIFLCIMRWCAVLDTCSICALWMRTQRTARRMGVGMQKASKQV